ncbi:unnamed protein product [Peronospora belbahrii]|uniref:Protein kinase domain-containing protein n=1 Tax=Peronospora belbahrii TaxID=622444 RepID=A0AAU9LPM0_9STRA|nr:unnamed protein product [Peronospora belbahrii]CAH0521830.1 unnamed protein product [Peronospora belbahrii]
MKEYSLRTLSNNTSEVVSSIILGSYTSETSEEKVVPTHTVGTSYYKTDSEAKSSEYEQSEAMNPLPHLTSASSSHSSYSKTTGHEDSGNTAQPRKDAKGYETEALWPVNVSLAHTATPTQNRSSYNSPTTISTSESTKIISGGSISGLVVGITCLVFVIAAFVTMKKRKAGHQFPLIKLSAGFGDSQSMEIASSKLAPPGTFERLDSGRNEVGGPNMSGIFKVTQDDPFTRTHMSKGGIWDDPVLVAARIPLEKIQIKELLARGGFGQVFLASYNGQTVAVKTLLPETAEDMDEINALFVESKVMATLNHPCVVNFIGIAWESFSTICCVTEYLVGGDLRALLNHFLVNHTRPQGFDHDKVKIALDIAHGLTYLHSMEPSILHRDLKSRNVLLTSQLNAKLTDFGVSRERSDGMMTNAVGTSLWMAPEVMLGSHYDGKADVFSFGILLSELDTHAMPYANVRNSNGRTPSETTILRKVAAGSLQVEFSRNCPTQLKKLAQACISVNPKNRPTANEALSKLKTALTSFEVEEVAL